MKKENTGDSVMTATTDQDEAEENHSGIVQCKGYRCWATKGPDAKWRDMRGTLLDVLQVVAEF